MLFCAKKGWDIRRLYRENPERLAWILWGAMALVVLGLLLLTTGKAQAQPVVSDEILRLHVIANSDTNEDQKVKILVRDAIQEEFAAAWKDMEDGATCRWIAQTELEDIEACAERVLAEHGFPYAARVQLGVHYFPQRVYDDVVTLPEGRYWAVRVILGEGVGQNWWCVLYPPLCVNTPSEDGTVEVKSWIWEQLPKHWQRCLGRFWTGGRENEA